MDGCWLFVRLFSLGCVLTVITNFPAAFTHTSFNTAVQLVNEYVNASYASRGVSLDTHHILLFKSCMNNVWYAAQVVGALASPIVCDRYGRRVAYAISIVLMTSASAIQTIASTMPVPELLLFGRLLMALFSPLSDAALILYLQECSPTHLRGTLSSLFSTGYAVMCLIGMPMGHDSILGRSLTALLSVPIPLGILSIIFIVIMPETPKWLMIRRGDRVGALSSLEFFQGKGPDHEGTLEVLSQEVSVDKHHAGGSVRSILYTPHLRYAAVLSICALVLTLPFYPMLQSSTYFFLSMGIASSTAQLQSSLLMLMLSISCIISTSIIDSVPRRCILLSSGVLANVCLCVFAWSEWKGVPWLATSSVFCFVLCYGVGIGPVAWTISPELVPLSHRSVMFCMCYAAHSVLVVLTNFLAIPLFGSVGAMSFLPIFVVPSCVALAVLFFFLPETAGRETHQIISELRCLGSGKITDQMKA